jgi:hypothetical protein
LESRFLAAATASSRVDTTAVSSGPDRGQRKRPEHRQNPPLMDGTKPRTACKCLEIREKIVGPVEVIDMKQE